MSESFASEPTYPCAFPGCTTLRTKAEGGSTFTVCTEHWDASRSSGEGVSERSERRRGSEAPPAVVEDLLGGLLVSVENAMLWPQVIDLGVGLRGKPVEEIANVILETYRSQARALARDFVPRKEIGLRVDETGVSADRVVALYAAAAMVAGLSVRLCAHAYMPPLFEHVALMVYDPEHIPGPESPKGAWRYVDPWCFEPKLGELEREPADERQLAPLSGRSMAKMASSEMVGSVVDVPGREPADPRTRVEALPKGVRPDPVAVSLGCARLLEEALVDVVRSGVPGAGEILADAVLLRRKVEGLKP